VSHHSACGNNEDRSLPTRLLDLRSFENAGIIKLVETEGSQGRYAALSHCWGALPQITTTRDTLSARMQSIPISELSKTFYESVIVAQALSIDYLWIDSLCIIQGDTDDWAKEASKMVTVYQNALITIAATASNSGTQGLFRNSHDHDFKGYTRDRETLYLLFREHNIHLQDMGMGFYDNNDRLALPLTNRAWTLQERLLSPRVLHFTPNEIFFECLQNVRCECRRKRKISKTIPKAYIHSSSTRADPPVNHSFVWASLVYTYSRLEMTYPSDKLVAIGGLAKKFAHPGNRYLAGLWSKSLINDLVWCNNGGDLYPRTDWRAPSWSWASVEGSIWTGMVKGTTVLKYIHHAEVLDCRVIPKGIDEYGELTSGTLRLLGSCTPVTWSDKDDRGQSNYLQFPEGFKRSFDPDIPFPGDDNERLNLVCLLIMEQDTDLKPWRKSLVLRRLDSNKNDFERIGFLRTHGDDGGKIVWPAEKTVVEIV
jgi:hypothetical protein